MPKQISITLYKFDELDKKAQERALDSVRDLPPRDEWWDDTYADAEDVGLKLTGFGLDRDKHATGEFIQSALHTTHLILINHGEDCATHKTAKAFLELREGLTDEDEIADTEEQFRKDILEDYATILQSEYEHLYSDEYAQGYIEANEPDFTASGKLYRHKANI